MGIDGFIQLLAFVLLVIGFIGIALVVSGASRGTGVRQGMGLAAFGLIFGALFWIVSQGIIEVGPTERVVKFNVLEGELQEPLGPGIHVVIPAIHQTTPYLVSQQTYTMSDSNNEGNVVGADAVAARSVDGQEVRVDVSVIYRIDPEDVNTLHENWSTSTDGYRDGLIRPTIRSIVRDVIASFEAEQIYGGETRAEIQVQIETLLISEFAPQGIEVISVLMRDVNFSDAFINAIEAKQVEEQNLVRAETEAQVRRTQARGSADAAIESARGEAESNRIRAEVEAQVIRIRAEAEADALRIISQQIAANPNLIQYLYVQNLSDNVNIALVPAGSPFLFDANTFLEADNDFTAPEVERIVPLNNDNDSDN